MPVLAALTDEDDNVVGILSDEVDADKPNSARTSVSDLGWTVIFEDEAASWLRSKGLTLSK